MLKLYNNNDEEIIMNESKYEHIVHPFPPLYNSESRILILGSLPSVKSREQMFFYGHPQNRFWKMISGVFEEAVICNGKTSGKYYEKYQMKYLGVKPDILPSTSPANAAYSLGKLVEIWKKSIIY